MILKWNKATGLFLGLTGRIKAMEWMKRSTESCYVLIQVICLLLFIIAPTKTSPKKDTVLLAESRKIHFEEFEQTCQHKPKRDVGKLSERFR